MSTEAGEFAPTRRHGDHGDPGASGPGLALAQSGEDDDTDYDYYGTPSGNTWRPGDEPGQPPATNPGGPFPGREAAAGVRPAGSRRFSPSLIVRTWHHRHGRGSVCPDKETP